MLGRLDKGREGEGLVNLCDDSRLSKADWIKGVKGSEWGNCELIADCVRGQWIKFVKGRDWGNCVLTAEFVRGNG